jgi:riboflavin kinase/FMN adenylyltransferase
MGSFDGVHHGHRVIIQRLNVLAARAQGESVLITFHPHPRIVLYPDTAGKGLKLISTLEEKVLLLEETGLDHLVVLPFSKEFSRTTSDAFVNDYLVSKLGAHTIVVGFNHFFGHNKEGNYDSLYRDSRNLGFAVEEIPEQEIQNETVSSTKIRKALQYGHIQRANAYLEHLFMMKVIVDPRGSEQVRGQKAYGFHVDDPLKLVPSKGAYAISIPGEAEGVKALCWITDDGLRIFPLDHWQPSGDSIRIQFHKHLSHPRAGEDLDADLAYTDELIY